MVESLHSIRFKAGSVEFELTSTADEVAKARSVLQDAVLAALSGEEAIPAADDDSDNADDTQKSKSPRKSRRRAKPTGLKATTGDRAATHEALLAGAVEDFPDIGTKPHALFAAYAVLSWAHKKLSIDGLTAQEIQAFMTERWRLPYSYQAYAGQMTQHQRDAQVQVTGHRPKVYRLMSGGEQALKKYIAERAAEAKNAR